MAPAQFLAQKAIVEWGFPAEKVVVIRGESADPCGGLARFQRRNPYQGIFLSHPAKGLDQALVLFEKMRTRFPQMRLHVLGSERLWGDQKTADHRPLPQGAIFLGEKPPLEVGRLLPGYGFLLYLSPVIDGFSSATAEAMAAGLIVFAAAHGSNAELIMHGQNGFLIPLNQGLPDLDVAERLLGAYLQNPEAWNPLRVNARKHIPSWRSQAILWRQLWRRCWS
ncbi:MAG: glycosyltransferase [Thermoanaerobaculaceae bacterium]